MLIRRWILAGVAAALPLGLGAAAGATPIVVEAGWTLARTDTLVDAAAAHYNPVDGRLYAASVRPDTMGGGVYRIESDGSATLIASAFRPRAVLIDPATGDIFHAEARAGIIYRTAFGTTGRQVWVTGFHAGDDDPVGMAIAPSNYSGSVLQPGEALVADEGNNGPKEVWRWSPAHAEGESVVHAEDGSLAAPVDITIGADGVWLVDWSGIFEVNADGSVTPLVTSQPIGMPTGITVDPITGDLFVIDVAGDEVWRVDPVTGAASVMLAGFTFGNHTTDTAGIDATPDGSLLFVTDRSVDRIYTFALVPEPTTALLLGIGLAALASSRRRTRPA